MTSPTLKPPTATGPPLISDRGGMTDAVRIQILATEHWSLLATRSMTWNEIFSRASMFVTLLSAAVVALALVAQATGFGTRFRLFALLILPVVLVMGIATFIRLGEANGDDFSMVAAMNRLRRAYLELAPELEPYFTTGQYDDLPGILQSYGLEYSQLGGRHSFVHLLEGTPAIVAAVNVVVFGVIAALIAQSLGAPESTSMGIGIVAALAAVYGHASLVFRSLTRVQREHRPRFPNRSLKDESG